ALAGRAPHRPAAGDPADAAGAAAAAAAQRPRGPRPRRPRPRLGRRRRRTGDGAHDGAAGRGPRGAAPRRPRRRPVPRRPPRAGRAEELYRQLLAHAEVLEFDYNAWLDGAARTYRTLCRDREAGYVYICLGRLDRARDLFPSERFPAEAARILELEARPLRRD